MRTMARLEAALATLLAGATLLALVNPQWLEQTFGWEPDRGSGETEWGLAIVLALATVLAAAAARRHHRLAHSTA